MTDDVDDTSLGWDDEDEVTEEEIKEVEKSAAVDLMHEAKAGHVPELTTKKV